MMNSDPMVSVIIPVFNGAAYIQGAIESVLSQTFKDIEIIVVDDGSTDETFSLIEPWVKQGIVLYVRQANKGVSAARNTAIRLAKGKFLKFLDSDDLLYPQQLELQVNHLADKLEYVLSVTDFEFEYEDKARKPVKVFPGKGSPLAPLIQGNLGPPHIFLVRRSMVESIGGFDEGLSTAEDSDFWLRLIIQGGVIERVDYLGCRYRILKDSLDSKSDRRLQNICKVFEKLNRALSPRLNQVPDDVCDELLLKNITLMHRCFKMKMKPASCMPTALKVNQMIYDKKKEGLNKFLFRVAGAENIALFKYIKAYMTDRGYYENLNVATWRNEQH